MCIYNGIKSKLIIKQMNKIIVFWEISIQEACSNREILVWSKKNPPLQQDSSEKFDYIFQI